MLDTIEYETLNTRGWMGELCGFENPFSKQNLLQKYSLKRFFKTNSVKTT